RRLPLLAPRPRTPALARQECKRGSDASLARALRGAPARLGRWLGGEVNGGGQNPRGIHHLAMIGPACSPGNRLVVPLGRYSGRRSTIFCQSGGSVALAINSRS